MRRMLIGIALAITTLSATAGPPPLQGDPVWITNTPLSVAPKEVTIPFDKAGSLRGLSCYFHRVAAPPPHGEAATPCTSDWDGTLADGFLIRSLVVMPYSVDLYLNGTYSAASCAMNYSLSIDNGATFFRFISASWTPGNWETQIFTFAPPVEIPKGASLKQKTELSIAGGTEGQGCGVTVRPVGSKP